MDAFSPDLLAHDFSQLKRILEDFFVPIQWDDWQRRTGNQSGDWTLKQTLAHVVVSSEWFYQMMDDTLNGEPVEIPGLQSREDLPAFNAVNIAQNQFTLPEVLIETLMDTLEQVAARVSSLTPEQCRLPVACPMYNRPAKLIEVVSWHLSHIGMVHGAQLAKGARVKPLWAHYSPAMMQRQLTRMISQMSYSYWTERGGNLQAAVNFIARGCGEWHIHMNPTGGDYGEGRAREGMTTTFWARSADVLSHLLTLQLNPYVAVLTGRAWVWGNWSLALRIPYLFTPT